MTVVVYERRAIVTNFLGNKRFARLLLEEKLGRPLRSNEIVHHIDGDSLNDDLSNLQVVSRSKHTVLHKTGKTHRVSEEAKKRMSEAHNEYLKTHKPTFLGRQHTEEAKVKMREGHAWRKRLLEKEKENAASNQ